jgi:multidrug efflux pump subunit AcrA (membrane-fusion protein)
MEPSIFRKSSLERISSPEQLNEYIKITHPGVWGVILGCLAILIAVGFWGFYGNIPDSVKAEGVIFPQNGAISVIPTASGRISDMRVHTGDFVQEGQIIAVIPQENIIRQITELENNGDSNKKQISALINEYESRSIVTSPVSGIVLSTASANATVTSNEAIASIVKEDQYANNEQIICFVPTLTAKKLKRGMEVQVSPDFAPREEYGYMYGYITDIGTYPVSQADVLEAVGGTQYANGLLPQQSCVEVRVTLTLDSNSQDNIKWSNKKGEAIQLSIGTDCNLLIVVQNYKPYELLFR